MLNLVLAKFFHHLKTQCFQQFEIAIDRALIGLQKLSQPMNRLTDIALQQINQFENTKNFLLFYLSCLAHSRLCIWKAKSKEKKKVILIIDVYCQ